MNKRAIFSLLAMQLCVSAGHADTVVKAVPDTLPGNGTGSLSGFMVGAVAGPVGAAVGAGVGWLIGGEAQKASGLSGNAYQVRRDDGSLVTVRSPGRTWSAGDEVTIVNRRLQAVEKTAAPVGISEAQTASF